MVKPLAGNGKIRKVRDQATISYTMSRIRSKDTSIELTLRGALWNAGLRFRKNYAEVAGSPDVVFTKRRVAVFCDSTFWHGRDWEQRKRKIVSNRPYWLKKIRRNIARDRRVDSELKREGWVVLRFWDVDIEQHLEQCVTEVKAALGLENYRGQSH
jgi:DNA mismatch endonuclease, patch repair protein